MPAADLTPVRVDALDAYRAVLRAHDATGIRTRGARHQAATIHRARALRSELVELARAIDAHARRAITDEALRAAMTKALDALNPQPEGATP